MDAVGTKLKAKSARLASRRAAIVEEARERAASGESAGVGEESSGDGRYAWGTWVDTDKVAAVVACADGVALAGGAALWSETLAGDFAAVRLAEGASWDVTLRRWTGDGGDVVQIFPPGSHVLLKPLRGTVELQKLRRGRDGEFAALGPKKELRGASAGLGGSAACGPVARLDAIVRRVLASRGPEGARRLGVSHVRGVLLSGPPGCGKTLLARELARELGARAPQIVNGPEILDKFVGEAERKVRDLFQPAEDEYRQVGDASALHVIVFDEMDAIARRRGSLTGDTTGVRDGVVNQLLAKLDGVVAAPNVLVVGCTNRPELIDEALLRPGAWRSSSSWTGPAAGGAPSRIHTRQMRENGALAADAAALVEDGGASGLAARTELFSGAELAGLVRAAASHALQRPEKTVTEADLDRALREVRPAAATAGAALEARLDRGFAADLACQAGCRRRPGQDKGDSTSLQPASARWWAATALAVLRALCRRPPPPGNRLLVLATAAAPGVDAALDACFDEVLRVPRLGWRDSGRVRRRRRRRRGAGRRPDAPAPIKAPPRRGRRGRRGPSGRPAVFADALEDATRRAGPR
ncbi:hypothetical protein JL721_126 [Aureococcus anophagefferens]|nr:hypothetical protein JL721_126 [Aureococcus anophagefferens]